MKTKDSLLKLYDATETKKVYLIIGKKKKSKLITLDESVSGIVKNIKYFFELNIIFHSI